MKKVLCGIDSAHRLPLLKDGRLGLITNQSGVTKDMTPSYKYLNDNYKLNALFSPEHGIFGAAQAGAGFEETERDEETGVRVYSLYNGITAPTDEMMEQVDILCFDIQDAGARFYTYLYTMTRSMKVAAAHKKPFVVFDRMDPIGLDRVEGEILDEKNASFIGEYAVPHRYALTIGEFAKYVNEEKGINAELYVVPCDGLDRSLYFDDTDLCFVAPSPNMPTVRTALVYPGTCIFEAVRNVSEGRGTTQPFEFIGAPYIDDIALCDHMNSLGLPGVRFGRVRFCPTFSKFAGEQCRGVRIFVTDKRGFSPFECGCRLFRYLYENYELDVNEKTVCRNFGTRRLLDCADTGALLSDCRAKSAEFKKSTEKYWLY
ncbi:MAG: DUF1343 domain-containing protein [Clostridia bacterium]|nr:DUF1343 domain-containing protein [Clostridia bacterium]